MAAYAIQFRRGTTTQHNSFTGLLGEVTVDTDKKTLVVHDGSTTGGFPLMREGAAATSSTGSFTSNVSVGGTFSVTSTASFSDDVTITGDLGMTGHIIPSANVTYDLGSTTMMWRDVYVGPGSLYINGSKVLEDNSGTIRMSADTGQNIKVETLGTGVLQLVGSNGIQISGELNAITGDIQIGDHIDMNSSLIKELATPVSGTDAANKNYVDSAISTKLGDGSLSFDGINGDFSGNLTVQGNITVAGTTTTVNSETINLADNILLLNSNATGTASQNGGIEIERGDDLNVQFLWDETNDRWSVGAEDLYTGGDFIGNLTGNVTGNVTGNLTGNVTGNVTGTVSSLANHDTADLAEGTNLYWTTARGDANFATNLAASDTDDLSEGALNQYFTPARAKAAVSASGDLTYNSSTGVFSFTERTDAEVRGLVSASGDLTYNASTGVISFTERTDAEVRGLISATGDVAYNQSTGVISFTERTDTEVRGLISVSDQGGDGSLSYNNSTGVLVYTGPSATEVRAHFSAGTGISITNGVIANTQTEDYVTSGSFNTSTGVLTLTRLGGGTVTADLDGRYMNASNAFTYAHSSTQTVNLTVATSNASGAVTFDFNELEGAIHYSVYLNRQLLRPGEFSVNAASTTANLTISTGILAEDDELEVVTLKAANQS